MLTKRYSTPGIRLEAKMRWLAPGQILCDLSDLIIGHYKGFARQDSWGKAAVPI